MTFAAPQGRDDPETVMEGWDTCRSILTSADLTSAPTRGGTMPGQANNLLFMEGAEHRTLRRLVAPAFSRTVVDGLRGRLRRRAHELLAAFTGGVVTDAVSGVADPLALDALFTVMGVPQASRSTLGGHARTMSGLLEPGLPPAERSRAASAALRATAHFDREARAGREAGLHRHLEEAAARGEIRPKLARSTPVVVIHGGHENPVNFLSFVIAFAAEQPERFVHLAATEPELFVEELLRSSSPVRRVARWRTTEGCGEAGDGRPGDRVWVDLRSANHDPARIEDPADIDLSARRRHLSFGHGVHACPGAVLARAEGVALVEAICVALVERPDVLSRCVVERDERTVATGPTRITRITP